MNFLRSIVDTQKKPTPEEWPNAFFEDANLSPPKRSLKNESETEASARRLGILIETLEGSQRAKVVYMLGLGFDGILRVHRLLDDDAIKNLVLDAATRPSEQSFLRLDKIIAHKGGDVAHMMYPEGLDLWEDFLRKHAEWGDTHENTIFSLHKSLMPAYRYQETCTCYITAVALMVTYLNHIKFPAGAHDSLKYSLNVSRHIRNTMNNVDVCKHVFQDLVHESWVGGDSRRVLKELACPDDDSFNHISTSLINTFRLFDATQLSDAPFLISGFVVSDEFAHTDKIEFLGRVRFSRRSESKSEKVVGLHALLVVGIHDVEGASRRYLLQNSFKHKQWVVVDLDYLESMVEFNLSEKRDVHFLHVAFRSAIAFTEVLPFPNDTKALECISPRTQAAAIQTEELLESQDIPIPTAVSSSSSFDPYYWMAGQCIEN